MIEFAAITSVISRYAPQAGQIVVKQAQKNKVIIEILHELKLNPTQIPDDVDGVYAYSLVYYGVYKHQLILNLLREKIIKDYFWDAYTSNSPFKFVENTRKFLDQNSQLYDETRRANINLLAELEDFGEVFISVAQRTKSDKYLPYPDWDLDVYPKEFNALNPDPNQLVGQLWGRLQIFPQPEIQKILTDAAQSKAKIPRLRPITASLDTPGGNLLRTLRVRGDNGTVRAVAISLDGKTALFGSSDNTLKVWNLETGKKISTLRGHDDSVRAVAISPDGKTAVSGSYDNTLKLWNLETAEEISTLSGHNSWVYAVTISPDGKTALSGSQDKSLKLWNLETGEVMSTFIGESSINCCAISQDGCTIVAGEKSGRVHFLHWEGLENHENDH